MQLVEKSEPKTAKQKNIFGSLTSTPISLEFMGYIQPRERRNQAN